jgi:phospholipid/cholesterol/gamma-HCH transport system substrate-binding protein
MISRTTKLQLIVFALITMIGCSYVGAKYAELDKYFVDDTYEVTASFSGSGGIFEGAEVTYRGVGVGRVTDMRLSSSGVDVVMEIEQASDPIPSDVIAAVHNRSAVGEQYVDLLPQRTGEPYLDEGSVIERADTRTPLPTTTLLSNLDQMVNSVGRQDLRTVVDEFGKAFGGTGQDIGRIIDTSNSYIETADDHFDLTSQLIRDGRTVLRTQLDSASAIDTFANNLAKVSDTLVRSDRDIRHVIDSGSAAANTMRSFIRENRASLSQMFNNFVTNGEITVRRLHGIEQVLVLYPYVVEGGFTVLGKDPETGLYDAHFGMILTNEPHVCNDGYQSTDERQPQNLEEVPFNTKAHCEEPQARSNARGAQHHPPPLTMDQALNRAPVVATYDPETGRLSPVHEDEMSGLVSGADAARSQAKNPWKWLLTDALAGSQ